MSQPFSLQILGERRTKPEKISDPPTLPKARPLSPYKMPEDRGARAKLDGSTPATQKLPAHEAPHVCTVQLWIADIAIRTRDIRSANLVL